MSKPTTMELTVSPGREMAFSMGGLDAEGGFSPWTPGRRGPVGDGEVFEFSRGEIAARLTVSDAPGGGRRLDWTIEGPREAMEGLDSIALLRADLSKAGFERLFVNRRDIWLPTGARAADLAPAPDGPAGTFDADNLAALLAGADDPALLVGMVHPGRSGLEISYRDGVLTLRAPLEGGWWRNGRVVVDSAFLLWDRPLVEALEQYGRLNRVASCAAPAPVAWNSWDYFTGHITQQRMMEVLEAIVASPTLSRQVEAVVLDDCWARWGDWTTPYESFPDLPGLTHAISEAGYIPGVWYSPVRVSSESRWASEHPETILWGPNRGNYPIDLTPEAKRWALDYTHPDVLKKIHDELSWLRRMGFRYFKTDFLQAPNTNFRRPRFFDPSVTPVEGMRRAMETIRSAIGYDSYWLACGTEIAPLAGLPDAARVSDDIHVYFSTLQVCVRNAAAHFWTNGNLWRNDPDFLVVRGRDTASSPFMDLADELENRPYASKGPYQRAVLNTGEVFTHEEARSWANFQIVYGGTLAMSDHPSMLNEAGRALAAKVIESRAGAAPGVPLDLAERNLPRRWLRACEGGWLAGLFNFDDEPREIALSPRDLERVGPVASAVDLWTGEAVAWPVAVHLPPHQSKVFRLVSARP